MSITLDGTTGITSDTGFAADGVSFADNAPANSLVVNASGNVGVGTSSPVTFASQTSVTVNGSTYGRFDVCAGGTHVAQWFADATGSVGFGSIASIPLIFTTSNNERMRIDSTGSLLLSTTTSRTSPGGLTIEADSGLHISPKTLGSEGGEFALGRGTDRATAWIFDCVTGAQPPLRIFNNAGTGVVLGNGAQSWSAMSDMRLKTDVVPLASGLASIQGVECITYRLKDDATGARLRVGVSAQSLQGRMDEVLDTVTRKGDDTEYLSVRYSEMTPYLIKAIQEQQAIITSLTARIEALEGAAV